MIDAGTVPGRGHEYVCDKRTGLVLRITPTAATYYLKLETTTLRIGSASVLTLDQARDQSAAAKIAAKRGKRPQAGLEAFEDLLAAGMSEVDAWEIATARDGAPDRSDDEHLAEGPWRWKDLVKAFLADKEAKLKARYFKLYRTYLEYSEFATIAERPLSSLKLGDLEKVRNQIMQSKAKSAAWRSAQQVKEAITWSWSFHSGISGLQDVEYPWWSRLAVDYASGKREHVPSLQDLARTLVVAELHRTLGWTEHKTGPGTLAALWAVILTAQRTGPLCATRRERLRFDPERPGWKVAVWTGEEMKGGRSGGRDHALPIPPAALAVIERYWKEADGDGEPSEYAFPSTRGDGHVSQGSINQLLNRLQGVTNSQAKAREGKPSRKKKPLPARVDLFARYGIEPWVPHDVRRTLSTFLEDQRLGGAGSAILAHRPPKTEDEREKVETVTRLHYAKSQRLGLKAEGITVWVKAVLEAYETEKARMAGIKSAA
jgi:integrase